MKFITIDHMNIFLRNTCLLVLLTSLSTISVFAGDPARYGSAGGAQLLINSWGRSSGWGNANVAGVAGSESFYLNPAGLARTNQTEMVFARTNWLRGTDININNFSFTQNIGKSGDNVFGISLMSFDLGNIEITTTQQPDGGLGTYKPSFMNLGFGYGRRFTNSISGGVVARVISEAIPDVRTSGLCFDAGVQYATTLRPDKASIKKDDVKFGISIRNIGPDMQTRGDGISTKAQLPDAEYESTVNHRPASVQLPSLINIGAAYDIKVDGDSTTWFHRLTPAINYNYNAFNPDFLSVGLEYSYKEILMLRVGYNYHEGTFAYDTRRDAHTGINAGVSVQIPFISKSQQRAGKSDYTSVAIDYSYRPTNPFSGTHTYGLRINFDSGRR
jgi:hypothetical protein